MSSSTRASIMALLVFFSAIVACAGGTGSQPRLLPLARESGDSSTQAQVSYGIVRGSHADPPPGEESSYDAVIFPGKPVRGTGPAPFARFYSLKSKRLNFNNKKTDASGPSVPGFNLSFADIVVQPGDQCGPTTPSSSGSCISFSYPSGSLSGACGSLNWYLQYNDVPPTFALPFTPKTTSITGSIYLSVTSPPSTSASNLSEFFFLVGATCSNPHTPVTPDSAYFSLANVQVVIVDQTSPAPGTLVTLHDQVGAQESLFAATNPAGSNSYMANPINWTIPSTNATTPYVAGYSVSNTTASVTLPVNTTANPLSFYPTAPYGGSAGGTDPLTFEATTLSAGTAYHASVGYIIEAPNLISVKAPTGQIFIGDALMCNGGIGCEAIGTDGGQDQNHGIQWTAQWSSYSPYVHGQVGMAQLANITIYEQFPGPIADEYNDWYPSIDFGPQFGQSNGTLTQTLGPSATATYSAEDDTSVTLFNCQSEVWPYEGYYDYFNFLPDPKGNYSGIPVTVGMMTWQWEAQAFNTGTTAKPIWSPPPVVWAPLMSTSLTPSTTLPIWYHNAKTELNYTNPC